MPQAQDRNSSIDKSYLELLQTEVRELLWNAIQADDRSIPRICSDAGIDNSSLYLFLCGKRKDLMLSKVTRLIHTLGCRISLTPLGQKNDSASPSPEKGI